MGRGMADFDAVVWRHWKRKRGFRRTVRPTLIDAITRSTSEDFVAMSASKVRSALSGRRSEGDYVCHTLNCIENNLWHSYECTDHKRFAGHLTNERRVHLIYSNKLQCYGTSLYGAVVTRRTCTHVREQCEDRQFNSAWRHSLLPVFLVSLPLPKRSQNVTRPIVHRTFAI